MSAARPTRPCDRCRKPYPAMHTLPLGDARDLCHKCRPGVRIARRQPVGVPAHGRNHGSRVSREPIRADLEFHGEGYSG